MCVSDVTITEEVLGDEVISGVTLQHSCRGDYCDCTEVDEESGDCRTSELVCDYYGLWKMNGNNRLRISCNRAKIEELGWCNYS